MLISGIPVFFMEVLLGQFTELGAIKYWSAVFPPTSGKNARKITLIWCCYRLLLPWSVAVCIGTFQVVCSSFNYLFGAVGCVRDTKTGRLGSFPGRVIPKIWERKTVLAACSVSRSSLMGRCKGVHTRWYYLLATMQCSMRKRLRVTQCNETKMGALWQHMTHRKQYKNPV